MKSLACLLADLASQQADVSLKVVSEYPHVLLFDGVCNLCNSFVQYVIKRDPQGIFMFTSLQSTQGQQLIEKYGITNDGKSVVYIRNGQALERMTAVIEAATTLGGRYQLARLCYVLPTFMRNWMYNLVASKRYKWFGKRDECMVPSPEIKERFLD